ncbi:hypothetical protein GCM10010289_69300 [Streptomyces violascens]|nr:hypothetical protein GCM10010289_69300 [Streptomyces violascens]
MGSMWCSQSDHTLIPPTMTNWSPSWDSVKQVAIEASSGDKKRAPPGRDAVRGVEQSFAGGIFTQLNQELGDQVRDPVDVDGCSRWCGHGVGGARGRRGTVEAGRHRFSRFQDLGERTGGECGQRPRASAKAST